MDYIYKQLGYYMIQDHIVSCLKGCVYIVQADHFMNNSLDYSVECLVYKIINHFILN